MKPLIIVSGDGHACAPVETYRDYLDPKYRHLIPGLVEEEKDWLLIKALDNFADPDRLAVVDDRQRIQSGGLASGWDGERRLQELDAEGIAAELVFPGTSEALTPFFWEFNRPYPVDVRMAGVRAYHRWLADMIAQAKGRLIGAAEPGPSLDMDATLEELRFAANHGFRAVQVPGFVADPALPRLADSHFEPFWAACNDLGLVLSIHVGYGLRQGEYNKLIGEIKKVVATRGPAKAATGFLEALNTLDNSSGILSEIFEQLGLSCQPIWQLIFSGVFDRYPNLKLSVVECRADWVPGLKVDLDKRFLAAKQRPKLKMKPSEYFGRQIFITPSSPRRHEIAMRHEIGIKNFLFGADLPHPEGTWPNSLTWLRTVCHDVPEEELRAILGENAIRVYGLDEKWLAGIAAKIGPAPRDIMGQYRIDERVVADFNTRSDFSNAKPSIEQQCLDRMVAQDLLAAAQ